MTTKNKNNTVGQNNEVLTQNEVKADTDNEILKASELTNKFEEENKELRNQILQYKKIMVSHYAKKFDVHEDINLKDIDFKNMENVERSFLIYCDKQHIKYTKPTFKVDKSENTNNTTTPTKKGFYIF